MPKTIIQWEWEEAFDPYGFGDGDSWNGTGLVQSAIERLGYQTEADGGMHNFCIHHLTKGEERWELVGHDGVEELRRLLPPDVVTTLDREFNADYVYEEH